MKGTKLLVSLLICGLMSCASSSGYMIYVIDRPDDLLRAHDPKNDKRLSDTCDPDNFNKAKCIALESDEFYRMETELLQLRQELKDCQNNHL